MSKRTERPQVGGLDWITIYLYAILVVVGWMMVYAADFHPDHPSLLDLSMNYGKQLLFITLAFGLAGFVLLTDSTFFKTITWIIYAGVMAVLLVTPFVAHPINGSYSWL